MFMQPPKAAPFRRPPRWISSLAEIRRDLLAGGDERLDRGDRLVEHFALGRIELDLDRALGALRADHDRHAHVEPTYPVLAVEMGRAGKHALRSEERRVGKECRS